MCRSEHKVRVHRKDTLHQRQRLAGRQNQTTPFRLTRDVPTFRGCRESLSTFESPIKADPGGERARPAHPLSMCSHARVAPGPAATRRRALSSPSPLPPPEAEGAELCPQIAKRAVESAIAQHSEFCQTEPDGVGYGWCDGVHPSAGLGCKSGTLGGYSGYPPGVSVRCSQLDDRGGRTAAREGPETPPRGGGLPCQLTTGGPPGAREGERRGPPPVPPPRPCAAPWAPVSG